MFLFLFHLSFTELSAYFYPIYKYKWPTSSCNASARRRFPDWRTFSVLRSHFTSIWGRSWCSTKWFFHRTYTCFAALRTSTSSQLLNFFITRPEVKFPFINSFNIIKAALSPHAGYATRVHSLYQICAEWIKLWCDLTFSALYCWNAHCRN